MRSEEGEFYRSDRSYRNSVSLMTATEANLSMLSEAGLLDDANEQLAEVAREHGVAVEAALDQDLGQ